MIKMADEFSTQEFNALEDRCLLESSALLQLLRSGNNNMLELFYSDSQALQPLGTATTTTVSGIPTSTLANKLY